MQNKLMTIPELARRMGLSRIAVYKKVRDGQIPAVRVGRNYAISAKDAKAILNPPVSKKQLSWIDAAVKKVVEEYGTVLKWLSKE